MVKLNRRVIIRRWGTTKNAIGSPIATEAASWEKWAQVEDRSGTNQNPYQQTVWTYDYKVTLRYESTRQTRSNDTIDYGGVRMKIENITIVSEGFKHFEVCRCSKVDESASGSPVTGFVPQTAGLSTYNYTAGIVSNTFSAIPNKTIFGASKDGIVHEIVTTDPVDKQVRYVAATGVFTWGSSFEIGEKAVIQYIT